MLARIRYKRDRKTNKPGYMLHAAKANNIQN